MFNYTKSYRKLLFIFFRVVQSSINDFSSQEEWKSFAHALSLKIYRHLVTIERLSSPRLDPITGDRHVDFASINVLCRAMLENFLVFSHIYGTEDQSLGELRFRLWKCYGLMKRQKIKTSTTTYDCQIAAERQEIADLWNQIKKSSLYEQKYSKAQRGQLEAGNWMGVNKAPILAKEAGLHQNYFANLYNSGSGYGHSGYISAIQVSQARTLEKQQELANVSLGVGLFIMTHFLLMFVEMSTDAKNVLEADPDSNALFSRWHIQEHEWEKLYSKQYRK